MPDESQLAGAAGDAWPPSRAQPGWHLRPPARPRAYGAGAGLEAGPGARRTSYWLSDTSPHHGDISGGGA